jgi:hypothetical protein
LLRIPEFPEPLLGCVEALRGFHEMPVAGLRGHEGDRRAAGSSPEPGQKPASVLRREQLVFSLELQPCAYFLGRPEPRCCGALRGSRSEGAVRASAALEHHDVISATPGCLQRERPLNLGFASSCAIVFRIGWASAIICDFRARNPFYEKCLIIAARKIISNNLL